MSSISPLVFTICVSYLLRIADGVIDLALIGGSKQWNLTNARQHRITNELLQKTHRQSVLRLPKAKYEARYNKVAKLTTSASQIETSCLGPIPSMKGDLLSDKDGISNVITGKKRITS